jgi:fructan beta-fructosidase
MTRVLVLLVLTFGHFLAAYQYAFADNTDILIADFENGDYGRWQTTGDAFGNGPARGTLPGQMTVSRYQGEYLASSFHGGDDSLGTLTSPTFVLEKHFLNFLIGGGGFPNETCVNLIVAEQVVLSSTGPNQNSGGSEALRWTSWDVSFWHGQVAQIQLVDQRQGGWGHIAADHFVLSDAPRSTETVTRQLVISERYLHLPVKQGAPKVWCELFVEEQRIRRFEIELATEGEFDFVAMADLQPWLGQSLQLRIPDADFGPSALDAITVSRQIPESEQHYHEATRPAFHFTSRIGWLNDPNGLVYADGVWHLFYQHNPYGWNWGNMHWGHATSADLIHWSEQGDKIHPWSDAVGAAFSGSGLIDANNTSGLASGDEHPLLVFPFTDTDQGESLAYSADGGRTLKMYAGNPVLRHQGRDPKVFWYEPKRHWVMAVYDEAEQKQWIAFYRSNNLRDWEFTSRIEGFFECPDLFPLKHPSQDRLVWILHGADGRYMLGDFDGQQFTPTTPEKLQLWFGDFYAAQSYSDAPEGRRVQIGWGSRIVFPGQRFNQQMTIPVDLNLTETSSGLRMTARPVRELNAYRVPIYHSQQLELLPTPTEIASLAAPFVMHVTAPAVANKSFLIKLQGTEVVIDYATHTLRVAEMQAPLPKVNEPIDLLILVDRGSIEVFACEGLVAISKSWQYGRELLPISVSGEGSISFAIDKIQGGR